MSWDVEKITRDILSHRRQSATGQEIGCGTVFSKSHASYNQILLKREEKFRAKSLLAKKGQVIGFNIKT